MSKFTNTRGAAALLIGAVALSAMSFTAASAANCSYVFTKTLKKGSTGVEVMNLQKTLNLSAATMVASTGAGSAGNETMTFGSATHAAVVKFQAANSISPTSGLVGPLTRGVLNTFCSGTGTTTPTTPVATGPVSVSNGTMVNSTIVAGQAGAVLANFNFTGNGTVTNLVLQRTGVSTNNTLKNVYLYDGATRLTDSASVTSDGKVSFNTTTGLFTVSGSKTITVRADVETGTANQTVGVMLSSMTPMGGSAATVSNVAGNNLNISAVTTSAVSVTNNQIGFANPTNINAGLVNQNVWDANFNVSVREVKLKGLAFKYIGSAPMDALTNLSLYVDGVKVGTSVMKNVNGSMITTFDLMNSPVTLQTGTRLVQLRADVVKGTARSFQFQIQNSADYMLEDRDLSGVNVSPTYVGLSTGTGANFQINKGSIVLNQEPTFVETKVVGGATNVAISKFKVQSFGEDSKIETIQVTPVLLGATAASTTTAPFLQNVTLYANGQAVGSSQNWTSGAITFNTGSSFIVPAGATQILEVRADVRDGTGQSYTAGTVSANTTFTVVRGQSSQETYSAVSATGRTLTITTGNATFAKTGGFFGQTVSPNQGGVKIGSFTLQAGDAEDIRITNFAVALMLGGSMPVTNITNLKVTDSSTTVYNPTSPATNQFTMDVVVPRSTSKMFDIMADLGSVNSASSTVQADATITYRGVGTGNSTSTLALGSLFTTNNGMIATSTITKLASSPVQQLVVGGTTGQSLVTYNVKTVGGNSSAIITDMTFTVAPSSDAITSVTVGGKTTSVVGTVALVQGLNISVPSGSAGIDVPVTVNYGTVAQPGGLASQTSAATALTLTDVKYNSGVTVATVTGINLASAGMQLVASKPTLTVSQTTPASGLSIGENKIGEVTIAADAKGNVKVSTLNFDVTLSGVTGGPGLSGCKIVEGTSGSIAVTGSTVTSCTVTAANFNLNAYTIQAGTSKTFSVYATLAGTLGTSGQSAVSTKVANGTTGFTWEDVNGGGTGLTGANIYNYPTNSYSIKN